MAQGLHATRASTQRGSQPGGRHHPRPRGPTWRRLRAPCLVAPCFPLSKKRVGTFRSRTHVSQERVRRKRALHLSANSTVNLAASAGPKGHPNAEPHRFAGVAPWHRRVDHHRRRHQHGRQCPLWLAQEPTQPPRVDSARGNRRKVGCRRRRGNIPELPPAAPQLPLAPETLRAEAARTVAARDGPALYRGAASRRLMLLAHA